MRNSSWKPAWVVTSDDENVWGFAMLYGANDNILKSRETTNIFVMDENSIGFWKSSLCLTLFQISMSNYRCRSDLMTLLTFNHPVSGNNKVKPHWGTTRENEILWAQALAYEAHQSVLCSKMATLNFVEKAKKG